MTSATQGGHAIDSGQVRGTQSFVQTLSSCWRRPSLTALEVFWRWAIGIPILWIVYRAALRIIAATQFDVSSLSHLSVTDPLAVATGLATDANLLGPPVLRFALRLGPLLILGWIVVSSLGRTLVLRRADPRLQSRPLTLMLLAVIRIAALAAVFWAWFILLRWDARVSIDRPLAHLGEPNLVLYFALLIVGTLALFVLWAVISWVFAIAPLLAMLRNLGPAAGLRAALSLGPLKGKLIELNLVMGIVKIALIVLALVFSACPLPFTSAATQTFLNWWWFGVSILYLIASDFFHVARLVACLDLWREFESTPPTA